MTDLIPLRHHFSPSVREGNIGLEEWLCKRPVPITWRGGWAGVADPSCPQVLLQGMSGALVETDDARQRKDEGSSRTQS